MSAYNIDQAMEEYGFINADFILPGTRIDVNDYEGGSPDDDLPPLVATESSVLGNQPLTNQSSSANPKPQLLVATQ